MIFSFDLDVRGQRENLGSPKAIFRREEAGQTIIEGNQII
jgi:hypothetical protein